jgi:hypothetical protein
MESGGQRPGRARKRPWKGNGAWKRRAIVTDAIPADCRARSELVDPPGKRGPGTRDCGGHRSTAAIYAKTFIVCE